MPLESWPGASDVTVVYREANVHANQLSYIDMRGDLAAVEAPGRSLFSCLHGRLYPWGSFEQTQSIEKGTRPSVVSTVFSRGTVPRAVTGPKMSRVIRPVPNSS